MRLVDPRTGDTYDVPDDEAAKAQQTYGLVSEEEHQLQTEHGGFREQLRTLPGTAAAAIGDVVAGAGNLAISALDQSGSGTAPTYTGADVIPAAFTPEEMARRKANPTAAAIGGAIPAVAAGLATAGAALPEILGAGSLGAAAAPAASFLASEGVIGGVFGEAGEAAAQERPMTAEGVLYNGALNVAFAGVGTGLLAGARKVAGGVGALRESAQKAIQRGTTRAIADTAEELADPIVAQRAAEAIQGRADETIRALDEATGKLRVPVANNPAAQRSGLEVAADALRDVQPQVADELMRLRGLPRDQRFAGLHDLANSEVGADARSTLDALMSDPALWGDKAVEQAQMLSAARAARDQGPAAYADALRGIDDPHVQSLLSDLDGHLEERATVDAAQAFERPRRSVGAAGSEAPALQPRQAYELLKNETDVIDDMRELAGGGAGEKGAFEDFNDSFRESMNNRVKREDFARAEALIDQPTRVALETEAQQIAPALEDIAQTLQARGAKKAAGLLRKHIAELNPSAAAPESEWSVAGKSLEDLRALPLEGDDLARVKALQQNEAFAKTGKVTSNDGAQGITLVRDTDGMVLRDGRHRLEAARGLGRDDVFGRVVDGQTGEVLYSGAIPIKATEATQRRAVTGVLDRIKQTLDNFHMKAISDANAPSIAVGG